MKQTIWIALLVAYATGIAILSNRPLTGMPSGITHLDKFLHFAEFAIFMVLAWRATGKRWGLAIALSLAYAGSDELHQAFVPARDANLFDFLADAGGILFTGWILHPRAGLWRLVRLRILDRNRKQEGE